jgi:hypothetical protein
VKRRDRDRARADAAYAAALAVSPQMTRVGQTSSPPSATSKAPAQAQSRTRRSPFVVQGRPPRPLPKAPYQGIACDHCGELIRYRRAVATHRGRQVHPTCAEDLRNRAAIDRGRGGWAGTPWK